MRTYLRSFVPAVGADLIDKFCEQDTFKGEFFSELHVLN